jgi:hypothetical protein
MYVLEVVALVNPKMKSALMAFDIFPEEGRIV